MNIIKTKKQQSGKVSRDRKRYKSPDKRVQRQVLRNKYNIA